MERRQTQQIAIQFLIRTQSNLLLGRVLNLLVMPHKRATGGNSVCDTTGCKRGVKTVLTGAWPLLGNLGGGLFLVLDVRTGLRPASLCPLIVDRLTWASCSRSGVEGLLIRLTALQIPTSVRKMANAPKVQATIRLGKLYKSSDIFGYIATLPFLSLGIFNQAAFYVQFLWGSR